MGWLFAVALGMQERSSQAVWQALGPITTGHAPSIGAVVMMAGLIEALLPLGALKMLTAGTLFVLGLYRLVRHRHQRWGGMQVGFGDLTIWFLLMATAHGAGLMVLPVLFRMSNGGVGAASAGMDRRHHNQAAGRRHAPSSKRHTADGAARRSGS
jgi:hypothetical protein